MKPPEYVLSRCWGAKADEMLNLSLWWWLANSRFTESCLFRNAIRASSSALVNTVVAS